jgi:hypothetical protein
MTTKNEIWDQIKRNIGRHIPKSEFKTWLSKASLLEINTKSAVIEVPNKFVAAWLSENYSEHIQKLLHDLVGTRPAIRFSYETPRNKKRVKKRSIARSSKTTFPLGLDPSSTFSDFVKGRSNGLACSSALEVANNPSYKYNPLYIFSKWSLGKTHLLHAIGNEAMKKNPDKRPFTSLLKRLFLNSKIRSPTRGVFSGEKKDLLGSYCSTIFRSWPPMIKHKKSCFLFVRNSSTQNGNWWSPPPHRRARLKAFCPNSVPDLNGD